MKTNCLLIFAISLSLAPLLAQETTLSPRASQMAASRVATTNTGDYASDLTVVHDAQSDALEQARTMLERVENPAQRQALETAIKEMESAQAALAEAKDSPDKLAAALTAQQSAYQALLKASPREFRMMRSRSGSQGQNSMDQRQLDQLDMPREENRYETERLATPPPNAEQREQLQTAARLKELAQRQQDINERLRELQTALPAARTDQERQEIQRQLKRLRDEERQMLANLDELRQRVAQSPNASADTQRQMEQARSDLERAAREMDQQSASQALAAGARAQQTMQNLQDNLRRQTSSQFTEQMRQLRKQARTLERRQEEIARGLDALNNSEHQSLDNSAERQQLVQQMAGQQNALTNLLAGMRSVTERAEVTEPLLSKQLYDALRHASQAHTDNLLDMASQLTDRGFLPQAEQAERAARTNITALAQSVEHAAESVLGSEADILRYAQSELDDLSRQMEREIAGATNASSSAIATNNSGEGPSTSTLPGRERASNFAAGNNAGQNSPAGLSQNQSAQPPSSRAPGEGQGAGSGNQATDYAQGTTQTANSSPGGQSGSTPGAQAQNGGNNGSASAGGNNGGGAGGDGLRQFVQQLVGNGKNQDIGGPITGDGYVDWSERLREVEQVLDSEDLRNQLAAVRERAAVLRGEYRERKRAPEAEVVRQQIIAPLSEVRVWLREELARKENANSLVPLDRDPVPEKYSELVRQYYEKLGSAQ